LKFRRFLLIIFLGIFLNGSAQNLYDYYENLWHRDNIIISDVQKEVDSIIAICETKENDIASIKIAHEFSKKLFGKKRYKDAINYAEYEISKYRKLGLKNRKYAIALYNAGIFYSRQGDFKQSISYYKEVISINTDENSSARAYCQIGYHFYKKGDFYRSADYYVYGIAGLEKLDKKKLLIKNYLNYSHVLNEIETKTSLDKMLEVLDKANDLFSLVPNYSRSDFNILNNDYAIYYTIKERLDLEKVRYYCYRNLNKAIQDNDSTYIYSAYTNLGDLYTKLKVKKHKDSALFYLNKALNYTRTSNEKSIVLHNQSNYFLKNNKYREALSTIQKALIQSTRLEPDIAALPNLDGLEVSDNKYNVLLALTQKATILIKLYQKEGNKNYLELALANLLSADTLVNVLLDVSKEEGSRLYWREKASEVYLKGVLVSEILEENGKAFYFSEKKKALLLTEDIIKNTSKLELPETIIAKEDELKKQILHIENSISNHKNKDSVETLENKRFGLKQEYQKLEDSLKGLFPTYYSSKQATKIVEVKEVQESLDKETVIISYVSNQDSEDNSFSVLYAILISKTQSEIIKIGYLGELEKLIKIYRSQLSHPFETKQDLFTFLETASELYSLLIPKNKISMSLDQKHLARAPFSS